MKTLSAAVMAGVLLPALGFAQKPAPQAPAAQKLDLNFPDLAAKASEKAEVDLDGAALGLARQMAGAATGQAVNGQGQAAASLLSGVQGVFVRHYEFAEAGAYLDRDLDPLRKQVASNPAWSRIINVKEKGESTEIFIMAPAADQPGGFLIISTEAKEVNVVQILGAVELDRLRELVKSSISYDLKAVAGAAK
jgi:hypothetical protein